jgi:prepilin-type N-terminal cleavage/methylation domain-containing protein
MAENLNKKAGLTLIEVLIAMVILSVGVSSLMMAMTRCLAVVRTARNRDVARNLLRRVDIENPIDKKKIEETVESGSFDDVPGFSWEREISMVDEEERPGLFVVDTQVRWSRAGKDAFEEMVEYKYAPDAEILTKEF